MEKDTRNLFEKSTELTDEMLFYSCQDAAATWLVWQEQKKVISETEKKLWFEIDQPTVWAILDMPGIKVDKAKWQEMGEINREAMEKEKEKFPFNPASPQQSLAYFKKEEKAKIKDTNAESLEKLGSPMALRVVEYRKLAKLAGTYGLNWIEEHI
jgi:DNA polymerase I-like protein with 3'-5' exonuclease and polymerase domains